MKQNFFQRNKVLIIGLLASICASLYEFTSAPSVNWLVVGFSAYTAGLSYLANKLRGQWATIIGVMLSLGATLYTQIDTHHVNVGQLILTALVTFGMAIAPPPKPVTYEHNATIVDAKTLPPTEQVADSGLKSVVDASVKQKS